MTKRDRLLALLIAAVAGLVGGGAATLIWSGDTARAQKTVAAAPALAAESFLLVDGEGRVRAKLELDESARFWIRRAGCGP